MPLPPTVLERSWVRVFDDGEVAARRDAPTTTLLTVEEGTLEAVHVTADGRRLRLGTFRGPCAVDKVALLDGGTHTATFEALGGARVRYIPRELVLGLINDVASVRRHVITHLATEARRHQAGRVMANTADATTRTATWLVHQMAVTGAIVRLPPGGQQALGEAIGASRVTVNRCLQQLAEETLISLQRPGVIRILSPELLAVRASV